MVPSPVCVAAKQEVNHTRLGRKGSTRKSQKPAFKSGNVSDNLNPPTALKEMIMFVRANYRSTYTHEYRIELTPDMQILLVDL